MQHLPRSTFPNGFVLSLTSTITRLSSWQITADYLWSLYETAGSPRFPQIHVPETTELIGVQHISGSEDSEEIGAERKYDEEGMK